MNSKLLLSLALCLALGIAGDQIAPAANSPQAITPAYSIGSVFMNYPTSQELNNLILSADSFQILKLIQEVLEDDSLTCNDIIAYLTEIQGRIKSVIQQRRFEFESLAVVIQTAEEEINRLNREIRRLQGQRITLNLGKKRTQLQQNVQCLSQKYTTVNSYERQIKQKQNLIEEATTQIVFLDRAAISARDAIEEQMLAITEIDSQIRQLEERLNDARSRRKSSQNFIQRNQEELKGFNQDIKKLREEIGLRTRQINDLNWKIDRLQSDINSLEVETERLRSDIAAGEQRQQEIENQIRELRERIREEEEKLKYEQLDRIQFERDSIEDILPGISQEVTRQYYQCYSSDKFEVQRIGSFTFYTINGSDLVGYLEDVYGVSDFQLPYSLRDSLVRLRPFDVFSDEWTQRYGSSMTEEKLQKTEDFSRISDFWCLNPESIASGFGRVIKISNNEIIIRTKEGKDEKFHLGSCSRMEATIASIPKPGQNMVWKGVLDGSGVYDLYAGTFLQ